MECGWLISYTNLYHLFAEHIVFSPIFGELEFRLQRWNMTYLERNWDEGTWQKLQEYYSQHKIVDLYPSSMSQTSCSWKKPSWWKSINTHTHTHTHTCIKWIPFYWFGWLIVSKLLFWISMGMFYWLLCSCGISILFIFINSFQIWQCAVF